jgi:cyclomaltodextrinase
MRDGTVKARRPSSCSPSAHPRLLNKASRMSDLLSLRRICRYARRSSTRNAVSCLLLAVLLGAPLLSTACGVPAYAQDEDSSMARAHAPAGPEWLDNAVIYEIFPRAFSREGTLTAVTARLDALQKLGVNVLWIMPISPIGKVHRLGRLGSPYSIRDYYAIDPDLGTKEDFKTLVQAAHQRHMRVILDMVADHTSWDSVMMAHPEFYQHDAEGKIISPHGWSDVAALNYADPGLRRYMDEMFLYWLKTFDLDGFRCDAASFVPTTFWDQLRPQLKQVRPDVLLLAEASKPELMRSAFDLDYAWPLLATLNSVIQQGESATRIEQNIKEQIAKFPVGTRHMLISDDHDERRATVRYGAQGALAASALVFTLPGVPMLYNGMEVGDATESGGPELFDKVDIDWSAGSMFPKDPAFYRDLIALRESSPALQHGELLWLHNSDEQHVVSYLRDFAGEEDLVVVNLSTVPFRGTVEAAEGNWREVRLGKLQSNEMTAPVALPALSLGAYEVRIFSQQHPGTH